MSATGPAIRIHSLTEARLYLKVTACSACGEGPLEIVESSARYDAGSHLLRVTATCQRCGIQGDITFETTDIERRGSVPSMLGELKDPGRQPAAPVINPTHDPSSVIDVVGWLMLHTMISEAARVASTLSINLSKRAAVRRMQVEAGQCLDEALKFYEEDNDLPPRDAFFTEEHYRRFLDRPELFTRQRLVEMRGHFPR